MNKEKIAQFSAKYHYPENWIRTILKMFEFDPDMADEVFSDKEKTEAVMQNGTVTVDDVTLCCEYMFEICDSKTAKKISYCPICGKKIVVKL